MLDRTVESCSIGVAFGQSSFTDLDFADDVSLLAEMLELLVPFFAILPNQTHLKSSQGVFPGTLGMKLGSKNLSSWATCN